MKHIIVTGGNGFLGREICLLACKYKIQVISIARSGKPKNISEHGCEGVKWVSADIFQPDEWKGYLENCSAVIHCIGIVAERPGEDITYKKIIFNAAKIAGITAKANGVSKFVYISAGAGAPDTPAGYMANKVAAEEFLSSGELGLDLTILKPGMLVGLGRLETLAENEYIQKLLLHPVFGEEIKPNRPLPVESVAKVALYAATHQLASKKLFVDDIEQLSATLKF